MDPDGGPGSQRGFLFTLLDTKSGKIYFDRSGTTPSGEILPRRIFALWSPDGNRVAVNLEYGRMLQGVVIIQVHGNFPTMEVVRLPDELLQGRPGVFWANDWLNKTDLALKGFGELDYSVTLRFDGGKMHFVDKKIGALAN